MGLDHLNFRWRLLKKQVSFSIKMPLAKKILFETKYSRVDHSSWRGSPLFLRYPPLDPACPCPFFKFCFLSPFFCSAPFKIFYTVPPTLTQFPPALIQSTNLSGPRACVWIFRKRAKKGQKMFKKVKNDKIFENLDKNVQNLKIFRKGATWLRVIIKRVILPVQMSLSIKNQFLII